MITRAITIVAAILGTLSVAQAEPKRVLIYGDSNTWGWMPAEGGIPTERFPAADQWPNVARQELGADYEIVVDALSGRTTNVDDPTAPMTGAALNGAAYLPAAIAAHLPLDLIVIMLGTNDTKAQFKRTPFEIALGAGELIDIAQSSGNMFGGGWYSYPAPRVLLVAPPPLGEQTVFAEVFDGDVGVERSKGMAKTYDLIAQAAGAGFFDAGSVITTDGVDAVHFTAETQRRLGDAMADQIRTALE
jgi:lysophospholipase L1-like esterase